MASKAQKSKMHKVMKEHKEGKLHSGTGKPGQKRKAPVKSRKQAIAIGLSESGQSNK